MAKLWEFSRGHSKPAFSEKVLGGDQGKFSKNRSKSKPRLKGRKALLRKWYYPVIIMFLKRVSSGKECPNGQVIAKHDMEPEDIAQSFRILRKCQNKFDCLIFEMFFIQELKPTLNKQCDSIRAKLFV